MKPPASSRTDAQGRRLCTAHTSAGKKCRAPAVKGATVCINHGAAKGTPGREAADRLVLSELVGPAMMTLKDLLEDPDTPPAVRATVARDILDRNGYKAPARVEWDEIPPVGVVEAWVDQLIAEEEARLERSST